MHHTARAAGHSPGALCFPHFQPTTLPPIRTPVTHLVAAHAAQRRARRNGPDARAAGHTPKAQRAIVSHRRELAVVD
eukprot:366105-Chlamydomonas_euryale.AAC.5